MTFDGESEIRHPKSDDTNTLGTQSRLAKETDMLAGAPPGTKAEDVTIWRLPITEASQYVPAMTSANDIAAALRTTLPHLSTRKLHALLYLAQGTHLAADDVPLFLEPITATDLATEVAEVADSPGKPLSDAEAITVAVTVNRYGNLPAMDLEALIRGQGPWQAACAAGTKVVDPEWIRELFRAQDNDPEGVPSGFPRSHRGQPGRRPDQAAVPDDPEEIASFLAEVRSRL